MLFFFFFFQSSETLDICAANCANPGAAALCSCVAKDRASVFSHEQKAEAGMKSESVVVFKVAGGLVEDTGCPDTRQMCVQEAGYITRTEDAI